VLFYEILNCFFKCKKTRIKHNWVYSFGINPINFFLL